MEKKVLIEEGELKRLMDRQKEAAKKGEIFYSEHKSYSSEAWDTRKMAIDFLESKLLDDQHKKTIEQQKDDLQLLNDFFKEEIGYFQEEIGYLNQDNLTINAKTLKDKFVEFLRSGREIDLTHQELALFVGIIDDAQGLMRNEEGEDKKAENDRLNNIEKKNPELIKAMKAQTAIYRRKMQIDNNNKNKVKKSIMPGNYRYLNLNTQINKPKEIKKSNNNINNINYSIDYEEDKKEEPKDNINENLNIEREQRKFKKIDVKKSDRKNYRESNIIIDNNNDLNEIHGKTVIISSNSKHDDELNPKTTMIIRKKKVNKNIANQSMIVPNNITINTNVVGSKKALDIMQNMLSKKNINEEKDKQNNNKK